VEQGGRVVDLPKRLQVLRLGPVDQAAAELLESSRLFLGAAESLFLNGKKIASLEFAGGRRRNGFR
jgi:hypothetical protein